MTQFTLTWDNTEILNNSNDILQKVSYRKKSVGGAWLETGFNPANNLAKTATSAVSPTVDSNCVYEFKVEAICNTGGPVPNDNGIIEQVGFTCIVPDIVNTKDTSAIGINLGGTDITKATFTLRKSVDNTIAYGPTTANREGTMASVVASGLTAGTTYYWQVVLFSTVNGKEVNSGMSNYLSSVCGPYPITTDSAPVQNLVWIADQTTCEKEGGFGVVKEITGLSSPQNVWYDAQTKRVYVADGDRIDGNVYWFDPETATSAADMVFSDKVKSDALYATSIDTQYRRILFAGANSGGLIVYDIDTDTTQTIPYGSNASYSRISLLISDTKIYATDKATNSIIIFDRSTLTILTTKNLSTVPDNARFTAGGYQLIPVRDQIWVVAGSGSSVGAVGVYSADLSTLVGTIPLTGSATWTNGVVWQMGFYNPNNDKFYVSDIGSSKRFVIDTQTRTVVNERVITNKSGKGYAQVNWTINPVNNEFYAMHSLTNGVSDNAPIRVTYKENTNDYSYADMYVNQGYLGLSAITGTNNAVGSLRGAAAWEGTPGYNTDGSVSIISNSVGITNTGKKITLTLKQVDANNNNLPTGLTKPNTLGDANYIAPSVDGSCPITYSVDCPTNVVSTLNGTTLDWEFSIKESVRKNNNIALIAIFAYNTNTGAKEGTAIEVTSPFNKNYFSGSFNGLGGTNYTIKVEYRNKDGVQLQSC